MGCHHHYHLLLFIKKKLDSLSQSFMEVKSTQITEFHSGSQSKGSLKYHLYYVHRVRCASTTYPRSTPFPLQRLVKVWLRVTGLRCGLEIHFIYRLCGPEIELVDSLKLSELPLSEALFVRCSNSGNSVLSVVRNSAGPHLGSS